MIVLHVLLALGSLALASINIFSPSSGKLKTSYGLAFGTLASGVLLIIVNDASVLRTCLTGIVFFAIVSILNETARHHLATQEDQL